VEARAISAEKEARDRLLNVEADSAASLASAHGEARELTRRVTVLEGKLEDACQARDTVDVSFQELSDGASDIN
jgi:hypothetical protein